jgi:hypothetical protein
MSDEPNRVPAKVAEILGTMGLVNAITSVLDRVTMGDGGPLTRPLVSKGGAPEVIKAIIQVMKKVRTIPKFGHNKADDYDYVRAVDLTAKLQDALALNGLVMGQREVDKIVKGKVIIIKYQFDFWHESGQFIQNMMANSGACRFEFKSGTQDDKAPGKAHTAAAKSAVLAVFKIPADADQDIEREVFTDPDGQLTGEDVRGRETDDRPPDNGRPRDARPPDDRPPYDPETGEVRDRAPPRDDRPPAGEAGGPPPGFDDVPPFGEPPPGPPVAPGGASTTQDPAADYRRNVQALGDSLKDARTLDDADRVWKENADLLRGMSEATFEYFRENFKTRWNGENPPNI